MKQYHSNQIINILSNMTTLTIDNLLQTLGDYSTKRDENYSLSNLIPFFEFIFYKLKKKKWGYKIKLSFFLNGVEGSAHTLLTPV